VNTQCELLYAGVAHNVAGKSTCDGGLLIDLSSMKGIRTDPKRRTARVEAGVTWGELNDELQTFGLAATGGFVSTTGVAGLTLGGGLGWDGAKARPVVGQPDFGGRCYADGQFRTASRDENKDLFWGVRGGGGISVLSLPSSSQSILWGRFSRVWLYTPWQSKEVLRFFREYERTSPEEFTNGALLFTFPDAPDFPEGLRGKSIVGVGGVYAGPLKTGEKVLRPLREYGPPVADIFQTMPYNAAQKMADFLWTKGDYDYWRSGFLRRIQ